MDKLLGVLIIIAILVGAGWAFFGAPERDAQRQHEILLEQQRQRHQEQLAKDYNEALLAIVATAGTAIGIAAVGIAGIAALGMVGYAVISLMGTVVAMISKLVPRTVSYVTNNYILAPPQQHQAPPEPEYGLYLPREVKYSLLQSGRRED